MGRPDDIIRSPGEMLHLVMGASGSDYVILTNTCRDNGAIVAQDRKIKSKQLPSALETRIDMIPEDMYIKNLNFGPSGEWFLMYSHLDGGTGDTAYWDVPNTLCSDFLQARFRSDDVSDFIVAFGPNLSYVILDGDQGLLMSNNVSEDLRQRVVNIRRNSGRIRSLSLFPNGGYFIADTEGTSVVGAPPALESDLQRHGSNDDVLNVVIASDYTWVILRRDGFSAAVSACPGLQRKFEAHYEHQNLYRRARGAELRAYEEGIQQKEEKKSSSERKRRENKKSAEAAREDTVLSAMNHKRMVQRMLMAETKGLKKGAVVTVVGYSNEPGDSVIERIGNDGVLTVIKHAQKSSSSLAIDDLRHLCVHYLDDEPRIEMVKLVKATDKFEAAVVGFACATCCANVCICSQMGNNSGRQGESMTPVLSPSVFSRSSLSTASSTKSPPDEWNMPTVSNSMSAPSGSEDNPLYMTESGVTNSGKYVSPAQRKKPTISSTTGRAGVEPFQARVHFLPVFEERGERLPYDEYRCPEKIDVNRLSLIVKYLKTDRKQRTSLMEALSKQKPKNPTQASNLQATFLRKLRRCHEMEMIFDKLYTNLKDYPTSSEGCVVHEVAYKHKDSFNRGRIFSVGKNVKGSEDRYPRNTTLQTMPLDWIPPLCGAFGHYVEIENSQARILCGLAERLNLLHLIPTLVNYRDNYKDWTEKLAKHHNITMEAAQKWPNIIMMGGMYVYKSWLRSVGASQKKTVEVTFAYRLAVEVTVLTDETLRHEKFRWATADRAQLAAEERSSANIQATMLMRVVQSYENEVLSHVQRCFYNLGWDSRSKAFDSVIVEKGPDAKSSLRDCLNMCQTSCMMQGWDIKLIERELHGKQDMKLKTIEEARVALAQLHKYLASQKK